MNQAPGKEPKRTQKRIGQGRFAMQIPTPIEEKQHHK